MGERALILVDLQNDFCPGGPLAVPHGDEVIELANQLQAHFKMIIATQDWHPQDHISFASNHPDRQVGEILLIKDQEQILWPDHCVQNTPGAALHPNLNTSRIKTVFHKGTDKKIDSYSAFYDNAHQRATGLGAYLKSHHITDVYLMGLATDYCVKYSSLDAVKLGFKVYVIEDACKGVERTPGDSARALTEMRVAGVHLIHSSQLLTEKLSNTG